MPEVEASHRPEPVETEHHMDTSAGEFLCTL
jgi:hypothetical protein